MPYVARDENGKIVRASVRTMIGNEVVSHSHPEILEFLMRHQQDPQEIVDALKQLQISDGEMTRAIEDLIMLLLKKNIFRMSELPRAVQDRIALRVRLRAKIEETYEKASHTLPLS